VFFKECNLVMINCPVLGSIFYGIATHESCSHGGPLEDLYLANMLAPLA